MYHRVNPLAGTFADPRVAVMPEAFEAQMTYLAKKGWRVISLAEAARQISEKRITHTRQIVITFDDGYPDNYYFALSILAEHKFPATIFLVSERVGKRDDVSLSPVQIQEMQKYQIDFGAHTVSHPKLTHIPLEKARREIIDSKMQLEDILGCSVTFFAYPSGMFAVEHVEMLREAGYTAAVTVAPGVNGEKENIFHLRRTEVSCWDTLFLPLKLRGAFDWKHIRSQKKRGLLPLPQPLQKGVKKT